MISKKIIIAIDGHASCGKSTLAKDLSKWLSYNYIDTGAMYRAVTLFALENNLINLESINLETLRTAMNDIEINFVYDQNLSESHTYLNGKDVEADIRGMHVSNYVSQISVIDFVRTQMVILQQKMGQEKGIVMDGRDIGTVVFPEADIKFFVTATPQIRAERRYKELITKNQEANYDAILNNVIQRDQIDSNRKIAPLTPAKDAIFIDNSNLSIVQQLQHVKDIIISKF